MKDEVVIEYKAEVTFKWGNYGHKTKTYIFYI